MGAKNKWGGGVECEARQLGEWSPRPVPVPLPLTGTSEALGCGCSCFTRGVAAIKTPKSPGGG